MSNHIAPDLQPLVDQFREAMRACETLYRSSADECVQSHPHLITGSPDEFVARMMDLHRGMLIKIFVDIAHIDWKWKASERRLAQDLFEHVWGKRLDGEQLKVALSKIIEQRDFKWSALVSPFERLAPLRN